MLTKLGTDVISHPSSTNCPPVTDGPSTAAPSSPTPEPARVVVVDLETLRAVMRDVVAEIQPAAPQPDFYSQTCLPPGMTRRAFLDAIRRGELPARAAGKARLVAREDYRAYVASAPPVHVRLRAQPMPANDVRALLRGSQGK